MDKIAAIQAVIGVKVDGIWGPKSQAALEEALKPAESIPAVLDEERVDDRSERAIKTLLPSIQGFARRLVRELIKEGINAKILSGSRTYAEQNALYEQGRSKPGNIITNARGGYSWHNFGVAIDIGIFQEGKYLDESPLYKKAGEIGKEIGFEWGGDWQGNLVDEPHFQWNPNHVTLATARELAAEGKSIV